VRRSPIAALPVVHFAITKTADPPLSSLVGESFTGAGRRAKRMLFPTTADTTLLVHLMTAGRMSFVEPGEKRPPQPVFVLQFEDGGELAITERATRKQMRLGLYRNADLEAELDGLGPEPLASGYDVAALREALARGGQLHGLLRDQRAVAGIGRAYANEILHSAQLSPFALADRLTDEQVVRLYTAMRESLTDGIERFRRHGPKMPQSKAKVKGLYDIHGHAGEPCPRCREELRFVDFAEHTIVYCPACQTGGTVYADRRRSRLLR
jgi:formamidopyrimidine-DNA glycosylase